MLDSPRHHGPIPRDTAAQMMPLVRRIAFQLARRLPRHVSVDDLIGAGCVGLVSACTRLDPDRPGSFAAYAETRIRGAMLDELRAIDPLSRDQRTFANRVARARRVLAQSLGHEPGAGEIAEHLQVTLADYWNQTANMPSCAQVSYDDEGEDAVVPQDASSPADERLAEAQSRRLFHAAVEGLPPRLRQVVELHCGEGLTLLQIGTRLGVTESRVCQLLADATQRLRLRCASGLSERCAPQRGLPHHSGEAVPARLAA